jgi:competence protein ComEA
MRLTIRAQKPAAYSVFGFEKQARSRATPSPNTFSRISATPTSNPSIRTTNPAEAKESHPKDKTPLGRIDINTATEKELTTIPGIGHVMAARIIAARPFRSADDLKRVSGIGDKKYAQFRPYLQ